MHYVKEGISHSSSTLCFKNWKGALYKRELSLTDFHEEFMALKHGWIDQYHGLEKGAWRLKYLRLISLCMVPLPIPYAFSSGSCSEMPNSALFCREATGPPSSHAAVIEHCPSCQLPCGSSDFMTMDCDHICSAPGAYEFSYHPSSDNVAHFITWLNNFWVYIQTWHRLWLAAAVLVVCYKSLTLILSLQASNSFKWLMLLKLRFFSWSGITKFI